MLLKTLLNSSTAAGVEIIVVIVIAFVLVHFVGEKTSVIGASMNPTLSNKDEVIINKFIYTLTDPKRDDVVVFRPNGNENTIHQRLWSAALKAMT